MSRHLRLTRLAHYTVAEFRRIGGSRSYWLYHAGILFVTLLFAADLFLIAKPPSLQPGAGLTGYTDLFFGIWIRGLPLCLFVCASVSWAASDSQHGMVRVVLTQPISRLEFAVGKLLAIGAHTVILLFSVVLAQAIACLALGGVGGLTLAALTAVAGSMLYGAGIALVGSWISVAVALIRRTIGSAAVGMLVAFILLGFVSYAAADTVLSDFAPLRYVLLPFRALVTTEGRHSYSAPVAVARSLSLVKFAVTALGVTSVFVGPALAHLHYRDISE